VEQDRHEALAVLVAAIPGLVASNVSHNSHDETVERLLVEFDRGVDRSQACDRDG